MNIFLGFDWRRSRSKTWKSWRSLVDVSQWNKFNSFVFISNIQGARSIESIIE